MPKKIPAEVVERIIRMENEGVPQWEIASQLGYHRVTICRLTARHNERIHNALIKSHVAERGRQFKLLGWMWREAREEWLRSKQPRSKTKAARDVDPKHPKKGKLVRVETEVRSGLGDPAYLDRMSAILAAMRVVLMMEPNPKPGQRAKPADGNGAAPFDVRAALEQLAAMSSVTEAAGGEVA
jgi:hypothetical protein